MKNVPTLVALLFAALSTAVAAHALMENQRLRSELEERGYLAAAADAEFAASEDGTVMDRLLQVEAGLARVDEAVATRPLEADGPTLEGREEALAVTGMPVFDEAATDEKLKDLIDDAVAKKAREIQIKQNKKPDFEVFAGELELTEPQRAATEREIVRGQKEILGILETPLPDGTNLMDELVDIFATSIAKPGSDPGWGKWFGRIVSETMPGTDQTYAEHIGGVQAAMAETFKRDWRPEQYQEFEAWGVKPNEIEGVPGSPNEALQTMIIERAQDMGWAPPEGTDK